MFCSPHTLTQEQKDNFERDGYLLIKDFFTPEETALIRGFAEDVSCWGPPTPQLRYTQHYEIANGERTLCRVENFVNFHAGLEKVARGRLMDAIGQLFGEPARLFKEKINYKMPGGGGYYPHYDGPSTASVGLAETFITAQVAIDKQTVENGCLQVVAPRSICPPVEMVAAEEGGDPDSTGRVGAIPMSIVEKLPWQHVESDPGDIILFHGYLPHRSAKNSSDLPRRTLYMLYNPASEGDFHDEYYQIMEMMRADFARKKAMQANDAQMASVAYDVPKFDYLN